MLGSTSMDSRSREVTPPWPVPNIDSDLSIGDFLKFVNDNLLRLYADSDEIMLRVSRHENMAKPSIDISRF